MLNSWNVLCSLFMCTLPRKNMKPCNELIYYLIYLTLRIKIYQLCKLKRKCWHHCSRQHHKRCHAWPTRGGHVAEQCHVAGVIFVFACLWTKVAHVDKFRGHFFAFASSWTKVAHADKFWGLFFTFSSSWTKMAQGDNLKGRRCILLFSFPCI